MNELTAPQIEAACRAAYNYDPAFEEDRRSHDPWVSLCRAYPQVAAMKRARMKVALEAYIATMKPPAHSDRGSRQAAAGGE